MAQIKQWEDQYGEDSDFFRVRVRGEFPATSENQFISAQLVEDAQKRAIRPAQYNFAPVILGVDMAWSGGDATAVRGTIGATNDPNCYLLLDEDGDGITIVREDESILIATVQGVPKIAAIGMQVKGPSGGEVWGRDC